MNPTNLPSRLVIKNSRSSAGRSLEIFIMVSGSCLEAEHPLNQVLAVNYSKTPSYDHSQRTQLVSYRLATSDL
jgi:hypothetical protein